MSDNKFDDIQLLGRIADDLNRFSRAHMVPLPTQPAQRRMEVVEVILRLVRDQQYATTFHLIRGLKGAQKLCRLHNETAVLWEDLQQIEALRTLANDQPVQWITARRFIGFCEQLLPRVALRARTLREMLRADGFDSSFHWPDTVRELVPYFASTDPPQPAEWPQTPQSWQEAWNCLETDDRFRGKLDKLAREIYPPRHIPQMGIRLDERAEQLVGDTKDKLRIVIIANAYRWSAQAMGRMGSLRRNKGRPRRTSSSDHAVEEKTWEGFLLNQFPTIMRRLAQYEKHPKGLSNEKKLSSMDNSTAFETADPEQDTPRRSDLQLDVRRAFKDLDPLEKAVAGLKFLLGMTNPQIAERLSVSEYQVKKTVAKVSAKLRKELTHWSENPP